MGRSEQRTWRIGLRQRIAVLVLVVPVSILLVGIPFWFAAEHEAGEQAFRERLISETRILALALADPCERGCLHEAAPPVNELLRSEPGLLSVEIYDPLGKRVVGRWGQGGPPFAERGDFAIEDVILQEEGHSTEPLHSSGHVFAAFAVLKTRAGGAPILRVRATSRRYNERAISALGLALIPGAFVGAGGLLLAYWLDRRLRRALKSLQLVTEEIAAGNFARRVEVRTGDEIETLGESVNSMAAALADQRARLDRHANELEERLAKRTLELETARAIAVSQERVAAMGVLAAGVVHEIGNPLTAASAIVQRLGPDSDLGEKREVLLDNLERIQRILRTLVDYARPPANEWRKVSINDAIRRTVALVQLDPRAKDVELILNLDPELPRVETIEDKLRQVLLNVLLNALDALSGLGGRVSVCSESTSSQVQITIDDSGPGVPADLRERILEPFFTTKGGSGGTGLGLAVSESIVAELGGSMEIGQAGLGGARFQICLPLQQLQEDSP